MQCNAINTINATQYNAMQCIVNNLHAVVVVADICDGAEHGAFCARELHDLHKYI